MSNVIIIHGTGGNPEGNWFPWLKEILENGGCKVFIPRFPTPENQSLESWLRVFDSYLDYLNEDCIVVGHSLGCAFLLSVLEKSTVKIKASFFVSGFLGLLDIKEFDELNESFVTKNFDWEKIRNNCGRFYVINSDDDPYVPLKEGRILADKLGTELVVLAGAGHINKESGFIKFELLEGMIKDELS